MTFLTLLRDREERLASVDALAERIKTRVGNAEREKVEALNRRLEDAVNDLRRAQWQRTSQTPPPLTPDRAKAKAVFSFFGIYVLLVLLCLLVLLMRW